MPALSALVLAGVIALAVLTLERRTAGLSVEHITVDTTPVTLYRPAASAPAPLVVVAHGFGGSRQMMDQLAITLGRAGFVVANFDFPGHGRNPTPMSADIDSLDGTTKQLVAVTAEVMTAIAARADVQGPVSLVGHSMATDVIVRAAALRDDIGAVAAISMYSEAVTASHPRALIVVSGATEGHLRQAALTTLQQIAPDATEGTTVTEGDVTRRAVVAPWVGHVGVLYSSTTLDEISRWLIERTGHGSAPRLDTTGWVAGVLLLSLVIIAWPLARLIPQRAQHVAPAPARRGFWRALLVPVPVVIVVALAVSNSGVSDASFAPLIAFFAAWGLSQLVWLRATGRAIRPPETLASLLLLAWGLGVFALALDRYAAAFLPLGERLPLLMVLLLGTVPLMLADANLVACQPWWRRLLARLALIAALFAVMASAPQSLGLNFTVLPVLLLFFVVYGTFARLIERRRGPGSASAGSALALAWALAASTPLFAG